MAFILPEVRNYTRFLGRGKEGFLSGGCLGCVRAGRPQAERARIPALRFAKQSGGESEAEEPSAIFHAGENRASPRRHRQDTRLYLIERYLTSAKNRTRWVYKYQLIFFNIIPNNPKLHKISVCGSGIGSYSVAGGEKFELQRATPFETLNSSSQPLR